MEIIKAMAVGVPTISFACDVPSEIINDGIDGVLVEANNEEEFLEKLIVMMRNDAIRKEMQLNINESIKKF